MVGVFYRFMRAMKKLISILFLFLTVLTSHAQVELRYCEDIEAGYGSSGNVYFPYVQFAESVVRPYVGATVSKVLIGLKSPVTNVTVYIKNSPKDTKPLYSQKVGELAAGWNEVELTTPFVIPEGEDVSFGYKCTASGASVGYSHEKYSPADQIQSNSQWTTCGGSLCIKAIVEGDNLPKHEMLIGKLNGLNVAEGDEFLTLPSTVRNAGTEVVTSYTVLCQVDDYAPVSFTIDHTVEPNKLDSFSVNLPLYGYSFGTHNVSLIIDKVNGVDDEYSGNNTVTSTFYLPDQRFARTVVCEEFTGLWCGFCPRGMVGMEMMKEAHPGRFIAICMHAGSNDPMEIPANVEYTYKPLTDTFPGAPSCTVDRRITGDPFGDIQNMYRTETSATAAAAVKLSAHWNSDRSAVEATIRFFSKNDVAHAYRAAFVVTEDSIYGGDHGYRQTNYYAGGANGELFGWENKDGHTTDVWFNDIARGIYSNWQGDVCSPETMVAEQEYTYSYTVPIPPTVFNKDMVKISALLIDPATGSIINADQVSMHPSASGEASVNEVCSEGRVVATTYLNIQGQEVVPQSGSIVIRCDRMDDGTTKVRKFLVK